MRLRPGTIERDVFDGADRIEAEIEFLAIVKRERVVKDAVVVRELDAVPTCTASTCGEKLRLRWSSTTSAIPARRASAGRFEPDDGIAPPVCRPRVVDAAQICGGPVPCRVVMHTNDPNRTRDGRRTWMTEAMTGRARGRRRAGLRGCATVSVSGVPQVRRSAVPDSCRAVRFQNCNPEPRIPRDLTNLSLAVESVPDRGPTESVRTRRRR